MSLETFDRRFMSNGEPLPWPVVSADQRLGEPIRALEPGMQVEKLGIINEPAFGTLATSGNGIVIAINDSQLTVM